MSSTMIRPDGSDADVSPRASTRQLEGEIATLRDELATLVAELDRRRHELMDLRLQARRHVVGTTLTGVGLLASAAGFVWLGARRARRRRSMRGRVSRLRKAVSRMAFRPERVASEPTIPAKILTAAANAAVATAVTRVLERGIRRALSPRERHAPRLLYEGRG